MTTFEEVTPEIADARLIAAEGKIFALTHVLRDFLAFRDSERANAHLQNLRELAVPDDGADPSTQLLFQSARELFDQLMSDAPPTPPIPPTRPNLTLIKGGG